ncbi:MULTISPECIES: RNA polymerase sigma-70 factor [Butyricimonas]|uniref:RNA polymerase sigma-70 factor n=1 Tax=Butyricimonas TaxID=574697 RepID=UPI001D082A35|nr:MULTISPECIES: RNA polymerase sigma-70 factor [Butyricimonas]MCB6974458.1 RNA polymerase sigma-70 factor [Butyricimonas synergistica]MCG4521178.1 RNA polymerase sigma-70 factor [Butyricimonas sp. DFI.6.44]
MDNKQSNGGISNTFSPSERDTIRELFEQHYTPLVLFARNYVPDMEADKDIVQEIFLALIESAKTFGTPDELKAYLYTAVKNKCLKHLRHEKVKQEYSDAHRDEPSEEETYFNRVLEEEVCYSLLVQEIELLPDQCQKVFKLILEGKANPEIAADLHISIETVKSHKQSGKKILHDRLVHIVERSILLFILEKMGL